LLIRSRAKFSPTVKFRQFEISFDSIDKIVSKTAQISYRFIFSWIW